MRSYESDKIFLRSPALGQEKLCKAPEVLYVMDMLRQKIRCLPVT